MEFRFHPKSGYKVYEDGTIISPHSGNALKQCLNSRGYYQVSKDVGYNSCGVHRIVIEAFIGKIPEGLCVNHKDGNKLNNHISNLEICTLSENTIHAIEHGLLKPKKGEEVSWTDLNNRDVLTIYNLCKKGLSNKEIGSIYKLHDRYVSLIRHGKRWSHLYKEKLPESFDSPYGRETLIEVMELIENTNLNNTQISKETEVEVSQVCRLRAGKTNRNFLNWYNNYFKNNI